MVMRAGRAVARVLLPAGVRGRLQRKLVDTLVAAEWIPPQAAEEPTIAEGWDFYARVHRNHTDVPLGEEWNEPDVLGVDCSADSMVAYLDERVFAPFLGECETLVEIGAGGGRFTEVLAPRCRRLIAADTSPTMIEFLRERFAGRPGVEPLLLDGTGLGTIGDGSADAVFSFDVFVHLQHWDIFNYLREIRRVLRPGGRLLLHHANTLSPLGWEKFLTDVPLSLNKHKLPGTFSVMTPDLMGAFVERAGLRVEASLTDVVRRDCITLARG